MEKINLNSSETISLNNNVEQERQYIHLEDIVLQEVSPSAVDSEEFDYYDVGYAERGSMKILNGQFRLDVGRYFSIDNDTETYLYKVLNNDEEIVFEGELQLDETNIKGADYEATVAVHKLMNIVGEQLSKGFGIHFYESILEYINNLAIERNVRIYHVESQSTDVSSVPLTKGRWGELFGEVLQGRGYENIGENEWKKIYNPQVKSESR